MLKDFLYLEDDDAIIGVVEDVPGGNQRWVPLADVLENLQKHRTVWVNLRGRLKYSSNEVLFGKAVVVGEINVKKESR